MLDKLEKKLGRYAIPHLIRYLLGGYVIGYLFYYGAQLTNVNYLGFMTLEPYEILHRFQIWRLLTWVMMPPSTSLFWALIMMFFYFQLGTILEQNWGTFRFNVYIFGGMLFTILGAFLLYGIGTLVYGAPVTGIGSFFSTSYINMTIFLAFAMMYPDMEVRLYFIIPIKMRWMALVYAVLTVLSFVITSWPGRVAIAASLLNFLIFFFATKSFRQYDPRQIKKQHDYAKKVREARRQQEEERRRRAASLRPSQNSASGSAMARHRCAVCGRTELTNPELTFRFCSRCNGNYEYCQDHLFTHKHVE